MNIEDVFSTRLRIKIVKILALTGELNVSEIARRLGVNYKTTRKHLEVLENENMIKHKLFGRIRLYKLNKSSPKTEAVQNLIQTWDHADNQ